MEAVKNGDPDAAAGMMAGFQGKAKFLMPLIRFATRFAHSLRRLIRVFQNISSLSSFKDVDEGFYWSIPFFSPTDAFNFYALK